MDQDGWLAAFGAGTLDCSNGKFGAFFIISLPSVFLDLLLTVFLFAGHGGWA